MKHETMNGSRKNLFIKGLLKKVFWSFAINSTISVESFLYFIPIAYLQYLGNLKISLFVNPKLMLNVKLWNVIVYQDLPNIPRIENKTKEHSA